MLGNSDFKEMLSALNAANVEYLLVGAHAVMYYAEPRFTRDLDLWVSSEVENTVQLVAALRKFGAPLGGLTAEDFQDIDVVFQIGVAPIRIDILTTLDGLEFHEAWKNRVTVNYDGIPLPLISRDDLIRNKEATGRPQDLLDVARLRESSPPA